jgi:hypothetical protein
LELPDSSMENELRARVEYTVDCRINTASSQDSISHDRMENVCTQCELRISRILRFSASLLDKGKATDEAGEELSCAPYLEKSHSSAYT